MGSPPTLVNRQRAFDWLDSGSAENKLDLTKLGFHLVFVHFSVTFGNYCYRAQMDEGMITFILATFANYFDKHQQFVSRGSQFGYFL